MPWWSLTSLAVKPPGTVVIERLWMARAGIVFGLILCGVTFAGLVGIAAKTPTQFFPMMLGIPLLFLGVVALNPHRRRFAMAISIGISVLGVVCGAAWTVFRLASIEDGGSEIDRYSLRLIGVMVLVCIVFAISCAAWFRRVRRKSSLAMKPGQTTVRLPSSLDSATDDADVASSREIA